MTDYGLPKIKLASELLSKICSNLDKPSLKLTRLACKALDGAAVPRLFDRVYVASRYADLEVARLVAARFRPFVKTLVYCSETYNEYSFAMFREKLLHEDYEEHYTNFERGYDYLRFHWEFYCRLKLEHEELNRSGEIVGTVCYLLGCLPNLRRIILSDRIRERTHCPCSQAILDCSTRAFDPVSIDEEWKRVLSETNLERGIGLHESLCFRPQSMCGSTDKSLWHEVLHALSITNNGIKEITFDSEHLDSGLNWQAFSTTGVQAYHAKNVLPNLVKMKLLLAYDENYDRGTRPDFGPLKKVLPWATGLGDLSIEIQDNTRFMDHRSDHLRATKQFSTCLGKVELPKLKTLALSGFRLDEQKLVKILSANRSVKYLVLDDITLVSGSWKSLAEQMRQMLEIVSIDVSALTYFLDDEDMTHVVACNSYEELNSDLERFFRHGGMNPFDWAKIYPGRV